MKALKTKHVLKRFLILFTMILLISACTIADCFLQDSITLGAISRVVKLAAVSVAARKAVSDRVGLRIFHVLSKYSLKLAISEGVPYFITMYLKHGLPTLE